MPLSPPEEHLKEFVLDSNAIENIYDNPDIIERHIKRKDERGHVGAMLLLESLVQGPLKNFIDKNLICTVQGLILKEQNERKIKTGKNPAPTDWIGCFRRVDVSVGGHKCAPSETVEKLMEELIKRTEHWQQKTRSTDWLGNISCIADFHYSFLKIHPFADGNGRTARALTWYLMKFACIKPFIFTAYDKHEKYYPCFHSDNSYTMIEYFKEKFIEENQHQPS